MTTFGIHIFDLFICVIEVFLLTVFLKKLARKKTKYTWQYLGYCLFLIAAAWFLTFLGMDISLKTVITLALQLILVFLFFEQTVLRKIFLVITYKLMLIIADFLSLAILLAMWGKPFAELQGDVDFILWGSIISKLILFTLVLLVMLAKKSEDDHVPARFWLLFLVFPVISILVILLLFSNQVLADQVTGTEYLIAAVCGIILMNMLFLFLFNKLSNNLSENFQLAIEKERLTAQNQFIELLLAKQNEIKSLWHDLKHHLLVINSYAQKADNEQIIAYINSLEKDIRETDNFYRTGNLIIDSIINQKHMCAQKHSIDFQLINNIQQKININENDLCLLLSNALDNAIEGVIAAQGENKTISIQLATKEDNFIFTVKNPCGELYFNKQGQPETTKQNKNQHGYGLKSMERIAEKHHGNLNIDYNNHEFTLDIILKNTSGS